MGVCNIWYALRYSDLRREEGTRCLKTSFFVISIISSLTSIISLYLGVSDLKQIRLAEEQRTVEPATQGNYLLSEVRFKEDCIH